MSENPWAGLPTGPPYVLPEDEPQVLRFNAKPGRNPSHSLRIDDMLPEPFVGAADAPVVLLSNNPGVGKAAGLRQQQAFMDRMRTNLLHEPSDYPFLYLDPKFDQAGKWWERKLKHLLKRFQREVVARSIVNIPYFPYASERFGHRGLSLPSQQYTFRLVREAMNRQAVIVFMRGDDVWLAALPELAKYERRFQVNNVQNPAISPNNCPDHGFQTVVEMIAAEVNRQS